MNAADEGIDVLDTHTCLDLLRTREVGRLAVSITDHPDIFPINYVVDRGTVVFRTAEGTKLAAALLGRGVAFEIDGYDPEAGDAWSVVVKGYAIEIEQMQQYFEALELPLFPWHAGPKHRFVRIEPVTITGRRFHVVERESRAGDRPDARRAAPE
jgi:nitroimidazol reductase NimA-like FMN-containing flavoprotein (pyridoxamine 5'-phosphate oxidase superfamily)